MTMENNNDNNKTKLNSTKKLVNNSQFVPFAKPTQPVLNQMNVDLNTTKTTSPNFGSDTVIIDGFSQYNHSLLDLFECDDIDINHDVNPISNQQSKMKPASSSTQISSILHDNYPSEDITGSKNQVKNPNQIDNENGNVTFLKSMDSTAFIEEDKLKVELWEYAKDHLTNIINQTFRANLLHYYTIKHFLNKLYKYYILNSSASIVRICKIPFIFAQIKTIISKGPSITCFINDDTEEIKCSFSNTLARKYSDILQPGSVIVLKDISTVRTSLKRDGHHLNVSIDNLLFVYYCNRDENPPSIEFIEINPINPSELIDCAKTFDKTFKISNQNTPTSIPNVQQQQQQKRSNNLQTVPSNASKQPSYQPITNQVNRVVSTNVPINAPNVTPRQQSYPEVHNQPPNNRPVTSNNLNNNPNRPTNTNAQPISSNTSNSNKRQFKFNANKNTNNNNEKTVLVDTQKSTALSEDVFSQLIFGIEDELLKEDD